MKICAWTHRVEFFTNGRFVKLLRLLVFDLLASTETHTVPGTVSRSSESVPRYMLCYSGDYFPVSGLFPELFQSTQLDVLFVVRGTCP